MQNKKKIIINNIIVSILTVLICFFVIVSVCGLCFYFVLEKHPVAGYSMRPLINADAENMYEDWDTAYVNKNLGYNRGDVVVATVDWGSFCSVIKHVVAFPGDTLQIREENGFYVVYVNGQVLKLGDGTEYKKQINAGTKYGTYKKYTDFIANINFSGNVEFDSNFNKQIVLHDDEYFLLGYDWTSSDDSLMYGVINSKNIEGKVDFVIKRKDNGVAIMLYKFGCALFEIN